MAGCEQAPTSSRGDASSNAPPFTNHAWTLADDTAPRGSLWVFLADGTLLQDSCFETYRLSRWSSVGDGRLRWDEDGLEIRATIENAAADSLVLRLHLVGGDERRRFVRAPVPYVCPDLPR